MKKTLKLMLVAMMAFGMMACGGKKITEEDLKKVEAALFNDDMTANPEAVSEAVEKFCQFAKQNPDNPNAPEWLFKAFEISVSQKDTQKSEEICNQLMKNYPNYDKTPFGMFMLASFIYDDQQKDLDKARGMYEKIMTDYPESEIIPSVEASLKFLGMTAEEIVKQFEAQAQEELTQEEQ